jgi:ribosome-interacting GTPase 1
MPANLSPEYLKAEEQWRAARTTEDKLAALEEMLRTVPKHKGTEKMQADLKRRIAKLRKEPKKKGARTGPTHHVDKEGMRQVLLLGPPSAGKSRILAALTNARPEVSSYPYTTREPAPAVMFVRKARVQLVDTPAISADCWEPWMSPLIRAADALALVADLASPTALEDLETVMERLESAGIFLGDGPPPEAAASAPAPVRKRAVLLCNKADVPGAAAAYEALRDLYDERFPVLALSAQEGRGLEEAAEEMFALLRLVRVFTKQPGKDPSLENPVLLPQGSTVREVAETIHKDLAARLKFARVWGSARFDGQRVERDHVVQDGDVVEVHA